MLDYPSDDDYELQIYAFADGHNRTQLYVVGPGYQSLDSTLDLVVLYSPEPLQHEFYPKPSKAHLIPSSAEIGLIAYHGDETETVYEDYPYTEPEDLDHAIDSLVADRLTLVNGRLGTRTCPEMIFHRCSSTAGASGGALVDANGRIFGITQRGRANVGIHIEGEYHDGVVDYTCENIGLPLDSPRLKEFVRNIILPIVEPDTRDAWQGLLEND